MVAGRGRTWDPRRRAVTVALSVPLATSGSTRTSGVPACLTVVPTDGSTFTVSVAGTPREMIGGAATFTSGTWRTSQASVTTTTRPTTNARIATGPGRSKASRAMAPRTT